MNKQDIQTVFDALHLAQRFPEQNPNNFEWDAAVQLNNWGIEAYKTLLLQNAEIERLSEALTRVIRAVPALVAGGGFVVDHHSPDGEYLGSENIDPALIIQEMATVAMNALAKEQTP